MFPYHRAEFLEVLVANAPSHYRHHFGKRFASYTDAPSGPVVLHFEDGGTAECDLLVGADGIKSTMRRVMYDKLAEAEKNSEVAEQLRGHIDPKWTGQVAYRGLIPREALATMSPDKNPVLSPIQVSCKSL